MNIIKLSEQSDIEEAKQASINVNSRTAITLPIQLFLALLSSVPKIHWREARESFIKRLAETQSTALYIEMIENELKLINFQNECTTIEHEYNLFHNADV